MDNEDLVRKSFERVYDNFIVDEKMEEISENGWLGKEGVVTRVFNDQKQV